MFTNTGIFANNFLLFIATFTLANVRFAELGLRGDIIATL